MRKRADIGKRGLRARASAIFLIMCARSFNSADAVTGGIDGPIAHEDFAHLFKGRCLWFSGDSITRESHFALIRFGFMCDASDKELASSKVRRAQTARSRLDGSLSPRLNCATVRSELHNRRNRVTVIPVSEIPDDDIVVRWFWAPHLDDHFRVAGGELGRELSREGGCDAFVMNSGAWEMPAFRNRKGAGARGVKARMGALFGALARATAATSATTASGDASSSGGVTHVIRTGQSRVFWRQMFPGDGKFKDADVRRYNEMALQLARQAGGPHTWDGRPIYSSVRGKRTRDGLHPNPPVQVHMMRHILTALASFLGLNEDSRPLRPARHRLAEFRAAIDPNRAHGGSVDPGPSKGPLRPALGDPTLGGLGSKQHVAVDLLALGPHPGG